MKTIKMTQGYTALVDDADFDFLSQYKWYPVFQRSGKCYACRNYLKKDGKRGLNPMHLEIMGRRPGFQIDHRDNNGLNNQRSNLRYATHSQNQANRGAPKTSTTGFKGVKLDKRTGKFVARISGKHIGVFVSPEQAHAAYSEQSKIIYGEFSRVA